MTENILKVNMKELETVRIICTAKQCGGIVEIPTDKLRDIGPLVCPCCNNDMLRSFHEGNPLALLGRAIDLLSRKADILQLEFPIKCDA